MHCAAQRSALHSSSALLDELRKQFMADSNIANPAVFLKAAALNDEGFPVSELITQMFCDGHALRCGGRRSQSRCPAGGKCRGRWRAAVAGR